MVVVMAMGKVCLDYDKVMKYVLIAAGMSTISS